MKNANLFVHVGSVDEQYTSLGVTKCRALAIYQSPVKETYVEEMSQVCGPVSTHVDKAKPDTKFEGPSSNLAHADSWFGRLCENIPLPSCLSILKTMFYIAGPEVTAENLPVQQAMAAVVLPAKPMPVGTTMHMNWAGDRLHDPDAIKFGEIPRMAANIVTPFIDIPLPTVPARARISTCATGYF
ncbi:hypothetical protein V1514DRAFT_323039 [Lipomyces japonicus]|uniref:uncharacterized protein n=1 Tax=Lipomyces japonicus TaxID=56871 RepID=UPI0034D01D32